MWPHPVVSVGMVGMQPPPCGL